jgi:hypothetical protein
MSDPLTETDVPSKTDVPPDQPPLVVSARPAPQQPRQPPSPADMDMMRRYFTDQRDQLKLRVTALESLLGFVESADDLAVRVAKLEQFTGVNKQR